jgi:hypothetical protein
MDFYGINLKENVTAEGTPDLGTVGDPMGTLYGEATSAQWGDLAEKYTCKGECDKGTVMAVSKDVEVDAEASFEDLCTSVIGVISFQPGFKMNDNLWRGKFIGLTGRLPVRIVGAINKGDFIVATKDGCARAGKAHEIAHKMGVANESNPDTEIKLVECVIK